VYFRSKKPIFTDAAMEYLCGAVATSPAVALSPTPAVHLLQDGTGITPASLYADFLALESSFTGYATASPNIIQPTRMPPSIWAAQFNGAYFTAGNPLTSGPQNALGYWIDVGAADPVCLFELFDAPIPFANPFDFLIIDIIMPFWQNLIIP